MGLGLLGLRVRTKGQRRS
ncbi:MAG TPA: hypothetical protein EYG08_06430 [Myxococcales bacterium]|nr:hypothetical protein [Myxococcales bacterium]HIK84733.1 hypothetical protein [Myxococcales bacterium]